MQKTNSNALHIGTAIVIALTAMACTLFAVNTQSSTDNIQNELPFEVHFTRMHALDYETPHHDLPRLIEAPFVTRKFREISEDGRPVDSETIYETINILSATDADLYRQAFAATHSKHFALAAQILSQVQDQSLAGHVLAERYLGEDSAPSYRALAVWLKDYAELPQAPRIYAKALQIQPKGSPALTQPTVPAVVRGNLADTGAELEATVTLPESDSNIGLEDRQLGAQINSLLRQGKGIEAEQAFNQAKVQRSVHPLLAKQASAMIAASTFFLGDATRIQILPEEDMASTPLAAWTSGLQAWRVKAYRLAARRFAQYASNINLSNNDRAAGYFWQARALQKLGATGQAVAALRNAADAPRSFYGMLALAQLGKNLTTSWDMPELTVAHLEMINATNAGRRGLALLQIKEPALAVMELQRIKVQGDRPLATALMALAHTAKLPALSLSLGSFMKTAEGGYFDAALYPIPPWQPTADDGGDRAIVYAVMRQESGFNPAAVSHCGARGLMQLMPRTASYIAPDDQTVTKSDLFDPNFNMALGARYIQHLAKQKEIAHSLLPVIAAYNGGPGNAVRWLKDTAHGDDPLLFIETLPVRETRNYMERVLSGYWVYQARLGQSQDSLHALVRGQWPSLAPHIQDVSIPSDVPPSNNTPHLIKIASR